MTSISHTTESGSMSPTGSSPGSRGVRLFYLDFIRALATILIVLTHFNNPYYSNGGYLLTNTPFGIYIGNLGLSLFLAISGAALTFTYKRPFDLKTFYWKRFKGIYPMFWIAWLFAFAYLFTTNAGFPPFNPPARNLIFTLLGVDGLVLNFHIPVAYLLGEWFLGFIIFFYIVFPPLLWGVEKHPIVTGAIVLVLYGVTVGFFLAHPVAGFPTAVLLTIRLPELTFGMYFTKYVRHVHWATVLPAAAVLAFSTRFPTEIPEDIATPLVGVSVFLILVVLGRRIAIQPLRAVITFIARYSYPIFLVHHVVTAAYFTAMPAWPSFGLKQRLAMFLVICLVTLVLSVGLDRLTTAVIGFATKAFSSMTWRPQVSPHEP